MLVRKRPLGQGEQRFEKWDGTQWIEISQREYEIYETPLTSRKAAVKELRHYMKKIKKVMVRYRTSRSSKKMKEIDTKGESLFSSLGKFGPLRYPKERTDNNQDYIQFSVIEYQRNGMTGGPVGSNFKVEPKTYLY